MSGSDGEGVCDKVSGSGWEVFLSGNGSEGFGHKELQNQETQKP